MYSFDIYKSRAIYSLYPNIPEFKNRFDTQELRLREILQSTGMTTYDLAHKAAFKYTYMFQSFFP